MIVKKGAIQSVLEALATHPAQQIQPHLPRFCCAGWAAGMGQFNGDDRDAAMHASVIA